MTGRGLSFDEMIDEIEQSIKEDLIKDRRKKLEKILKNIKR
jgi:hypothetical protein